MIKHIFTLIWNKRRKNFLLFLEIFLAFAILFSVFTLVTHFLRNYQSPLGFDTENIWIAHLNLEEYEDSIALANMKLALENELEAKPQIISASYMGFVSPFSGSTWTTQSDDNGFEIRTNLLNADEDHLETAGLKLVQGRWFTPDDLHGRYEPVVISRHFFEESFQDRNITDSVYTIQGENKIIGIVEHYKYHGEFYKEESATFFLKPKTDKELPNLMLRIKEGTPAAFEEEVNKTIAQITKRSDFTIEHLEASRAQDSRSYWIPMVALLSICGFLIINVALGLFGVLYYNISKRRSEIGLRRAIGATQSLITLQFIGEVFLVAFLGVFLGVFFAIQLPLLNVFEMPDINYYLAMLMTSGLIFGLVLLCAFYPSSQAARIHPAIALHEE